MMKLENRAKYRLASHPSLLLSNSSHLSDTNLRFILEKKGLGLEIDGGEIDGEEIGGEIGGLKQRQSKTNI